MKKTTARKSTTAKAPKKSAEPKGNAVLSIHPNLIEVTAPGQKTVTHNLDSNTPANFEEKLIAGIQARGYTVEIRRHNSQGQRVA